MDRTHLALQQSSWGAGVDLMAGMKSEAFVEPCFFFFLMGEDVCVSLFPSFRVVFLVIVVLRCFLFVFDFVWLCWSFVSLFGSFFCFAFVFRVF